MSFDGLKGSRIHRSKYVGCQYRKVRGLPVRMLSPAEIDEFKARINQIISPTLRVTSKFRRSVV